MSLSVIKDSVETGYNMKLFKTMNDALYAHIYKSKLVKLPISLFNNVDNFDSTRLKKSATDAYPLHYRL
jgi:hypothetical protein